MMEYMCLASSLGKGSEAMLLASIYISPEDLTSRRREKRGVNKRSRTMDSPLQLTLAKPVQVWRLPLRKRVYKD
jgi:hypothetical protein